VGITALQATGTGWTLFAPITITGQEDVRVFYDETLAITLDMLAIDYGGDPNDLSIQVEEGTGYVFSDNSITRTIEYDENWAAAGEEITVNVRVSDGTDEASYGLRVLVVPPMTQTNYSENTCLGTISLTVRAYRPDPGVASESFPFVFTLLTQEEEVIDVITFNSNFPGQSSASATFGVEGLDLNRNDAYIIRVEDNLGRTFQRDAGPIGEAYSLDFDLNVAGPLCAGDPGGVVEYIIYNAEVPLSFFGIYDEEENLVTELYDIVSLTEDYIVVSTDNLAAGNYTLEVTDRFGCLGSEPFEIVLPEPILAEEALSDPSCFGASDGQIDLTISGGWSQPFAGSPIESAREYAIEWFTAGGTELGTGVNELVMESGTVTGMNSSLSGLAAGGYYAEITESVRRFQIPDAEPLVCTITTPIFVLDGPDPLNLNATSTDISCHGAGDGQLGISPTGGTTPYTVDWYQGNVADPELPDATGLTALPAQAGDGPFLRQGLPAGDYAVVLTDANGCFLAENFSVAEPPPLSIIERTDLRQDVLCFGEETGTIVLEVDGPTTPPYFFEAFRNGAASPIAAPLVSLGFSPIFFNNLPAGEYRIRVTDSFGCTFDLEGIQIEQPPTGLLIEEPVISEYAGFQLSCAGASDGSIELSITGGQGALDFLWTGPDGFESTEKDIFDLSPGQYQFVVTDENGCTATIGSVEMNAPPPLTIDADIPQYNGFQISCFGAADGRITSLPAGGTGTYTYSWTGPDGFTSDQPELANLEPGNYELIVTDENGCSTTASYLLEQPTPLLIDEIPEERVNITCFGEDTGALTVALTLSLPPVRLDLGLMGETDPLRTISEFTEEGYAFTNLEAGNYWVRVTNGNGCTDVVEDIPIIQPENGLELTNVMVSDYNGFGISCQGAGDGFISLEAIGGLGDVSYAWTGPDGFTSPSSTISNLGPGTYELLVTDDTGCTLAESFDVSEPQPLELSDEVSDFNGFGVQCYGGDQGFINISLSGGATPFTIAWTGPEGFVSDALSLENLSAGLYELSVTDQNGCQISGSYNLLEPESLELVELPDERVDVACFGQETGSLGVTLIRGSTAPYAFRLEDAEGTLVREAPSLTDTSWVVTNLSAGSYRMQVRDANGCTQELTDLEISEPEEGVQIESIETSDYNGFGISCFGAGDGFIEATVSGGSGAYSFSWEGPNGFTSELPLLTDLEPGSYVLTVTDENGCILSETVELTSPEPLLLSDTVSSYNGFAIQCNGGNNGFIELTLSGGVAPLSVAWTGPDGFSASTLTLENLVAGIYEVTVTDQNACRIQRSYNLLEPEGLELIELTAEKIDVACFGQETGRLGIQLSQPTSAPYRYRLLDAGGTVVRALDASEETRWVVENLPAGIYRAEVSDGNGCQQDLPGLEISQPEAGVQIDAIERSDYSGFGVSCFGARDGFIRVSVSGGSGNYTFDWSGPDGFTSSAPIIENLAPGTYQVSLRDENGCTQTSELLEIRSPDPLTVDAEVSDFNGFAIQCHGANDGAIGLTVAGGTGNYRYTWTGPSGFISSAARISGLSPGTYQVRVIDDNNCEILRDFELQQPEPLQVALEEKVDVLCFGEATGSIAISVSGGVPDSYRFEWRRDGALLEPGTQNLTDIPAGTYSLSVVDANGCSTGIGEIEIVQPEAALAVTLNQTPISCFNANDANLNVDIQGGVEPYLVSWNIGSTQRGFTGIGPGFYQVTVTDANGCTRVRETVIEDLPVFDIDPEVVPISCHGAADGSILLNLEGGEAPVRATWDHGPEQSSLFNLGPGEYRVVLEDAKGCTIERTFNLVEPDLLLVVEQIQDALSCEDGQSGSIDLVVSGGTPPYAYNWSNGATTPSISGLTNGSYSVEITDQSGCFVSQTFQVNRPYPIVIDMISSTNSNCEPREISETFEINVDGGVAPYTIEWSHGDVSEDGYRMVTNEPGTYSVTVTDGFGCRQSRSFVVENSQVLVEGDFSSASFPVYGENLVNYEVQFINSSSGNIRSYYWDFGDGNNSLEAAPLHRYQEAGTYTVELTAYDNWGCSSSSSFQIEILDYFLQVPNVFSPNGDGINDYFFPKFLYIETLSFTIMNKWGEVLFHTEDLDSQGWDGSYRGQEAIPGNYVYKIDFTTTDGRTFSDTGALMLLE
jgi:gliding motility-associated-like protein